MSFLQPNFIKTLITRHLGDAKGRKLYNYQNEGIKYLGFKYYPRYADFKDPPYEPTKLLQVQRIKPVKGTPYWERKVLKCLGLVNKMSEIAIVKNTPETSSELWKIKHLVRITPITFPNGFPKDNIGTYLKENGELLVKQSVSVKEEMEKLQLTEGCKMDPKRMDGDTLRRQSRKRWMSGW